MHQCSSLVDAHTENQNMDTEPKHGQNNGPERIRYVDKEWGIGHTFLLFIPCVMEAFEWIPSEEVREMTHSCRKGSAHLLHYQCGSSCCIISVAGHDYFCVTKGHYSSCYFVCYFIIRTPSYACRLKSWTLFSGNTSHWIWDRNMSHIHWDLFPEKSVQDCSLQS